MSSSTATDTTNATPQTAPTSPRPLMNTAEAADYLRLSLRFVEKLVAQRKLRPARVGRRLIFKRAELDRFVDLQAALA